MAVGVGRVRRYLGAVMNNGDTARVEMRRARSFLEYADDDLSQNRWARAMSSSYYAAFHAAKAILALTDATTRSHAGLKRLFSKHAVRNSDFSPKVAKTLGRLEKSRLTADYDAVEWETFTESQAREATSQARVFVEEADGWLKRRTIEKGSG